MTAEWRVEPALDLATGRTFWWLMSGTNTLGKLYGERTAKEIVRAHNRAVVSETTPNQKENP